ncbi:hypothetical protein K8R61_00835 [bacterium]|nr:hypothetical protein [bacterium]
MNKFFLKEILILIFVLVVCPLEMRADSVNSSATVSAGTPNAPILVSLPNGSSTADNTPTLSANYSDPNLGDVGTTNYRISFSSLSDCVNNINVVAFGVSLETLSNNENTEYTPSSSIGTDGTYYWCAQNDDGTNTSSWTEMGNFILDTTTDNQGNGGNSGPPLGFSYPPSPPEPSFDNPEGGFKIIINPDQKNNKITNNAKIKIKFFGGPDTKMMSISANDPSFKYANLFPFQEEIYWDLKVENEHTIYAKFYTKYGYPSEIVSAKIILYNMNFKIFAYNKPRLKSLSQEQNIAKELKQELEKYYGINKIPVHRKHWHTIVNSYVYGNYPINAIIKAIHFGGKTVHPTIPFSAWKKAKDYINWINK